MTPALPLPLRFTVCTYNIWTRTRWPERRDGLRAFADLHRPDILCVQELQAESRAVLDDVLGRSHDRVDGPEEGWTCEGNIWWNRALFAPIGFGAENVGICEEHRRLFWVRLRVLDGSLPLVLQPGDAYFEELIEVGAEDGAERHSLQQRSASSPRPQTTRRSLPSSSRCTGRLATGRSSNLSFVPSVRANRSPCSSN